MIFKKHSVWSVKKWYMQQEEAPAPARCSCKVGASGMLSISLCASSALSRAVCISTPGNVSTLQMGEILLADCLPCTAIITSLALHGFPEGGY